MMIRLAGLFSLLLASSAATATDVFVDFGTPSVAPAAGWNDARALYLPGSISLKTTSGSSTGYQLTTTKRFTSHHPYGTRSPASGIPLFSARDGMYGNETPYGGYSAPYGELKLTGLNPNVQYSFQVFASVDKGDTQNRSTAYDFYGATAYTAWLNPTLNTKNYAHASVKPTSAGVITIIVRATAANNSPNKFYHIGHFKMSYTLPAATNTPPSVSASASPSSITLPTAKVKLTANATDNGSIASYTWSKVSGGNATLRSPSGASTDVENLAAGSYVFKVRVVDNQGAATEKNVNVTVNPAPVTASEPVFKLVDFHATNSPHYGYVEYLPRGYNTASAKSLPMIVFMHGIGERGEGKRDPNSPASFSITAGDSAIGAQTYSGGAYLNKLLKFGPNAYIRAVDRDLPFVILSIQQFKVVPPGAPHSVDWDPNRVKNFVDYALAKYGKVNPDRVHVTGLSLGGGGSLHFAYTHPTKIASLVTICPGYYNQSTSTMIRGLVNNNVAVWASHAYNDHAASFHTRSRKLMNHLATEIGGSSTDLLHYLTRTPGSLTNVNPEELDISKYMDNVQTTHSAYYDRGGRRWVWRTGQDPFATPSSQYPVMFTFYTNYPYLANTSANASARQAPHGIWTRIYNDPKLYDWLLTQSR